MDPIPYPHDRIAAYVAAVLVGLLIRRPWHQRAGAMLLAWPVVSVLIQIVNALGPLIEGGLVLRPYTTEELSRLASRKILRDVAPVLLGTILLVAPRLKDIRRLRARDIQQSLRTWGVLRGPREPRSAFIGLAGTFPLVGGAYLLQWSLAGVAALNQSDESSIWANMTPYHVLLLALAAGVGEELVYRGVLQGFLQRWRALPAILVQASVFAFAHAGFGTWSHVLLPFAFGLLAGVAAWRFGLMSAVVLHVLIDVFAFGVEAAPGHPWVLLVLALLLVCALAAALVVLRDARRRRSAQGEI